MPVAIAIPVRRTIFKRWQQGHSSTDIAASLQLSDRTVRHLIKRFEEHGEKGIETSYANNGRRMTEEQLLVREQVKMLRTEHPNWGSEVLRIKLKGVNEDGKLPSSRAIRKWLADSHLSLKTGENRPRPGRKPPSAGRPHETWQLDASEDICLKSGEHVSWVRLVDEYTGAFLKTRVFPPREIQYS